MRKRFFRPLSILLTASMLAGSAPCAYAAETDPAAEASVVDETSETPQTEQVSNEENQVSEESSLAVIPEATETTEQDTSDENSEVSEESEVEPQENKDESKAEASENAEESKAEAESEEASENNEAVNAEPESTATQITTQPVSTAVKAGETAKLSVVAEGDALTYQWQYSSDGTTYTDCTGEAAAQAEYSFTMSTSTVGYYRCVVKGTNGTVTSDAVKVKLDLGSKDGPTTEISGVMVARADGSEYGMVPVKSATYAIEGDKIKITFTTNKKKIWTRLYLGYCDDETKEPYVDGTVEGKSTTFTIELPISAANTWQPVSFWRPDKTDTSGNVTEAAHWKTDEYLWISIPDVTRITIEPAATEVKSGETAKLSVVAEGAGLTYQWQYSSDGTTYTDCTGDTATQAEYSFEMSEATEGTYRCVVNGDYGSDTSNEVKASIEPDREGYTYNSLITAIYSNNLAVNKANKVGTAYGMFKIAESSMTITGDNIEITVGVSPASSGNFSYSDIAIYTTAATDAADLKAKPESAAVVSGTTDTTKNLQFYTFTIPKSYAGSEVYFLPKSASKGTWSTSSELAFAIPALSEFNAPKTVTITTQPADVKVAEGGTATLSVEATEKNSAALTYQWQYSADGENWSDCTDGTESRYSFTMKEALAGNYRCVITSANGSSETSESAAVSLPKAPVVTGENVQVVKDDASNFKMFTVDSSEVKQDGDNLEITITTKNYSFDKIYFGYKDNAASATSDIVSGTQTEDGGYTFTFTRPASEKGSVIPISLGKPAGTWYSNYYLWMYIPDEGITEVVDADIAAVYGGTGASAKSAFNIESSKVIEKSDSLVITLNVTGNTYNKLYLGTQEEAKGQEATCSGSYDSEKNITSYTFEVAKSKQGMYIAVTPGNDSGYYTNARDIFINIPNLDNLEATSENGVYDLYGSAFPTNNVAALCFERESQLTIEDGKVKVTLVTQASNYDKIYIGSVTDNDLLKETNAVSFTERTDIGAAYKSATFEISLSDLGKDINYVVKNSKTDSWNTKQSTFKINARLAKTSDLPTVTPTTTPTVTPTTTPSTTPADGIYSTTAETGADMFKVVATELTVKNGEMTAKITLSGTGNKLLYMGTKEEAANDEANAISPCATVKYTTEEGEEKDVYQFEIPVSALDTPLTMASKGRSKWYDRTVTISSADLKKTGDVTTPTPTPSTTPADGIYSTTAETGADMFKVVATELTVKNGEMTAKITLSGTGNKLLYMGTKEEAANDEANAISPCATVKYTTEEGEEKDVYQFEIPVSALDTPLTMASKGRSKWYDRTVTISSANLEKIGDVEKDDSKDDSKVTPTPTAKPTAVPTATPTKTPDTTPDKESQYKTDTSGSTSAVNSSTTLADGVYTPDSFTFSGGTGKVTITCPKITVTNGQAYATIVFNSAKYGYVKANGNTYYPTVSGKTSTFTIPVELNKNNTIIGMTTAMSTPHEVEYKLFIYLAAAANGTTGNSNSGLVSTSSSTLDETAPEIVGLTYESEVKLENAEYFKIYNYEDGIVLLEIDTTKDTAEDPDLKKEDASSESEESKTEDASEESSESSKEEVILEEEEASYDAQVTTEDKAKLYTENVVKYLIVPENVDVPVGLDKDMIVIHRTDDEEFSAFVSSCEALGFMDELDSLDALSALGMTEDELKDGTDLSEELTVKEPEKTTKKNSKKSEDSEESSVEESTEENASTESTTSDSTTDIEKDASIYFAGSQSEPDFKQIVKSKVDLAILSSSILPQEVEDADDETSKKDSKSESNEESEKVNEETSEDETTSEESKDTTDDEDKVLTVEEQEELYADITEKMTTLGIPVIIDRSADEKSELARYEWIKVYGAIFGKSDEADKLYNAKVTELQKETTNEKTTNK